MSAAGLSENTLGFSDNRMAYHDTLARVCLSTDLGTLTHKVTARAIEDKYRSKTGFSENSIERTSGALKELAEVLSTGERVRFNKATLYSWLIFLICHAEPTGSTATSSELGRFLLDFENWRAGHWQGALEELAPAINLFTDRATARVADVSSIVIRDIVIWVSFAKWAERGSIALRQENHRIKELQDNGLTCFLRSLTEPHNSDFDSLGDSPLWGAWGRVP